MSTTANGLRVRWAAIGAAVAATFGAGGLRVVDTVQLRRARRVHE